MIVQFLCGATIFTTNICLEEITNNVLFYQKKKKKYGQTVTRKNNLKSRILIHTLNLHLFTRKSFLGGISI